ncbi:MAG TPA: hypothetical protein VN825_01875 [Candidatus Acidoferrum sp.]|nr:hypothetical protein [Candidatus Acidoferrum sp.]
MTGNDAKQESIEREGNAMLAANKKMNDFDCGPILNGRRLAVTLSI